MEHLDLNLLKILLSLMTFFIVIVGSLVNWFETYLPVFFRQTFRYGKFAYNGKPSQFKVYEVPKNWFKHFYIFSSIYSLYALHLVIDVYLYGAKPSNGLLMYLDFLCGYSRKTNCGSTSVILALSLITLQCFRRFYETWFVSVFSKGKINVTQYMVGYLHYWATITIVLAEASGFKNGKFFLFVKLMFFLSFFQVTLWPCFYALNNPNIFLQTDIYISSLYFISAVSVDHNSLTPFQIFGIIIFIYAWINQYKSAKILANLRKNSKGCVISTEHKIPKGGLFEHISSPHLTCEVLIYLSLWMILFNNQSFKYVFLWVLSNQLETSLLSHWWYQNKFKNYPKKRKAFIPFIL